MYSDVMYSDDMYPDVMYSDVMYPEIYFPTIDKFIDVDKKLRVSKNRNPCKY